MSVSRAKELLWGRGWLLGPPCLVLLNATSANKTWDTSRRAQTPSSALCEGRQCVAYCTCI